MVGISQLFLYLLVEPIIEIIMKTNASRYRLQAQKIILAMKFLSSNNITETHACIYNTYISYVSLSISDIHIHTRIYIYRYRYIRRWPEEFSFLISLDFLLAFPFLHTKTPVLIFHIMHEQVQDLSRSDRRWW